MTSYKKLILNSILTICILFSSLFTFTFYVEKYISEKKALTSNSAQYMRIFSTISLDSETVFGKDFYTAKKA